MIIVKKLIIHEIIKKEGETQKTEYVLSKELLPIEDQANGLVEELERRYSTLSHTNAIFDYDDTDPQKQVPKLFDNYQNENIEFDFIDFSRDATVNLKSHINSVPPAKGGYLIYVEYQNKHSFLAVFLVRNKKGNTFQFDSNKQIFKIGESIYIDFEHLAMAARINISLIGSGNRYITFINKAQFDSKYFLNWFCANDRQNNVEDTKTLRKILLNIETPTDDNGNPIEKTDFLDRVYNYIRALPKSEMVNLKSLGLAFYNDENKITNYAYQNQLVVNTEFRADKKELRSYVNLNAKADRIILNFPLNYIDKGIVMIEDDQIIIKSHKLAEKLQFEQKDHE